MSSLNATSATGNPRNKTALAPGKSLMDWVRLCNSGKDMTGTGGKILTVTPAQLATHNKKADAWLALRGIVYNVTEYMSFHPGGEDELMRGVGTDATKLFNNIHPWVNYESLLKSCVVGRLSTSSIACNTTEKQCSDRISALNSNLPETNISVSEKSDEISFKMDWYQQTNSVSLIFYVQNGTNTTPLQLFVHSNEDNRMTICIENDISSYELENHIQWPCGIKVQQSVIEIRLSKFSPGLWSTYGRQLDENLTIPQYFKMNVVHSSQVTHDTKLIGLQYSDQIVNYLHVGHHVLFNNNIEGEDVIRPYTPVSFLVPEKYATFNASLYFVIKEYNNGKLSRMLCSCKVGDSFEMSRPRGSFLCRMLEKRNFLTLFAAGTGITPLTSLIVWTLNSTKMNINLIYFNKTENDIIWGDDMTELATQNSRFQVTHILSSSSSSYLGTKGLVSQDIVKSALTKPIEESYVCICGPVEFNNLCIRFIEECGYTNSCYHCFNG